MATFKYFADLDGQTVQLANVWHDGHVRSTAEHFSGALPDGTRVKCTRMIERKSNPSLHQCGPRCVAARGFLCECSCGGKNHGKGN
jgi:hypothetical protein